MDEKRRSVVEGDEFAEQISALILDPEEADEFIAAAQDVLSRAPEIGVLVHEAQRIWSFPLALIGEKQVTLYYTFDEETVLLLAIVAFD